MDTTSSFYGLLGGGRSAGEVKYCCTDGGLWGMMVLGDFGMGYAGLLIEPFFFRHRDAYGPWSMLGSALETGYRVRLELDSENRHRRMWLLLGPNGCHSLCRFL